MIQWHRKFEKLLAPQMSLAGTQHDKQRILWRPYGVRVIHQKLKIENAKSIIDNIETTVEGVEALDGIILFSKED